MGQDAADGDGIAQLAPECQGRLELRARLTSVPPQVAQQAHETDRPRQLPPTARGLTGDDRVSRVTVGALFIAEGERQVAGVTQRSIFALDECFADELQGRA